MSGTSFFISNKNYLKRQLAGTISMAAPATSGYGSYYYTNATVTHSLGYIPLYRVYCETFQDGIIWPSMGTRTGASTINPINQGGKAGPILLAWPSTTTLTIQLFYTDNTLTGNYTVYYVIYRDVQL